MHSRFTKVPVLLVAAVFAIVAIAQAAEPPIEDRDKDGIADADDRCPATAGYERHNGCANRYVVNSWVHKPKKNVHKTKRFTPDAEPSVSKVKKIIALEYKRWGGRGPIYDRVSCESEYLWHASNGQYKGLIQAEDGIWNYMKAGMPRDVVVRSTKKRKKPVVVTKVYNTGVKIRTVRNQRTQTVHLKRKGMLPENPSQFHGWAAIRVGQRAVAGYRTTYWACTSNGSHY